MSVLTRPTRPLTSRAGTPTTVAPSGRWLSIGAYAGPVFLLGGFAQLPLNPGFDMSRHAFSFLSNGPHGWIQQTVFVITGLLNIAAGIGMVGALTGRIRYLAASAAMVVGTGQVVAGICPPDPAFGYPAGAPAGYPDQISLTSVLHGIAFSVSVIAWVVLLITLAVWLRRIGERGWAAAAAVVAVAVLSVPPLLGTSFGTVFLYVVVSAAFLFTAAVVRRLSRRC